MSSELGRPVNAGRVREGTAKARAQAPEKRAFARRKRRRVRSGFDMGTWLDLTMERERSGTPFEVIRYTLLHLVL